MPTENGSGIRTRPCSRKANSSPTNRQVHIRVPLRDNNMHKFTKFNTRDDGNLCLLAPFFVFGVRDAVSIGNHTIP